MIKNLKITGFWFLKAEEDYRKEVISFIKDQKIKNPNYKVVDVGGFGSSWSQNLVDAIKKFHTQDI